eukprot:8225686-Pyramimonas_sp.AAC.1
MMLEGYSTGGRDDVDWDDVETFEALFKEYWEFIVANYNVVTPVFAKATAEQKEEVRDCNSTSFYGSSCANDGKDALNTLAQRSADTFQRG